MADVMKTSANGVIKHKFQTKGIIPLLKCRMPPTIFDDSKQMMRMQSMHQFVHPYYTDGRG
jgi:hypothetical protein